MDLKFYVSIEGFLRDCILVFKGVSDEDYFSVSMVSVCPPSDALLQHLPSYLGFSYLGHKVSLHGYSSKAQPLLLTLDEGSWWRGLTECGPLEKGMANHSSIFALRTP